MNQRVEEILKPHMNYWNREQQPYNKLGEQREKRALEERAEAFLKSNRVDKSYKSGLSILQEAQLLTGAIRALKKAKNMEIDEYMRNFNSSNHDIIVGKYTLRMFTKEKAKGGQYKAGLYIFETGSDHTILIGYPNTLLNWFRGSKKAPNTVKLPYNTTHAKAADNLAKKEKELGNAMIAASRIHALTPERRLEKLGLSKHKIAAAIKKGNKKAIDFISDSGEVDAINHLTDEEFDSFLTGDDDNHRVRIVVGK